MQLKKIEQQGPFTSLYYELTWNIGWNQLISFADSIIRSDFSKNPESVKCTIGSVTGDEIDVTDQLKNSDFWIKNTEFSKSEQSGLTLTGESAIMGVLMKISLWSQNDRCVIQIYNDTHIAVDGEHCYDKYADSIELLGHRNFWKQQYSAK